MNPTKLHSSEIGIKDSIVLCHFFDEETGAFSSVNSTYARPRDFPSSTRLYLHEKLNSPFDLSPYPKKSITILNKEWDPGAEVSSGALPQFSPNAVKKVSKLSGFTSAGLFFGLQGLLVCIYRY